MKAEKTAVANPVVEALGEIVRVLKGIRGDIQELTAAVDNRWAAVDDDEFDDGDSKVEDTGEELPGLREEMEVYEEYLIRRRLKENGTQEEESKEESDEGESEGEKSAGNEEKPAEDDNEEGKAGSLESAGAAP